MFKNVFLFTNKKVKIILSIFLSCFLLKGRCQNNLINTSQISLPELHKDKIYLFCRGTRSKAGIIANKYSNTDKMISHVGIGYIENNKVYIYNVNDISDNKRSALFIDSVQSFIAVPAAYYFSLWEYGSSRKELAKLKALCQSYKKRKIIFDYQFKIADNDTLYCSEFCNNILQKAIPRFFFKPSIILLENKLYEVFLNRKQLVYYPADFFEKNRSFKKIYEVKF